LLGCAVQLKKLHHQAPASTRAKVNKASSLGAVVSLYSKMSVCSPPPPFLLDHQVSPLLVAILLLMPRGLQLTNQWHSTTTSQYKHQFHPGVSKHGMAWRCDTGRKPKLQRSEAWIPNKLSHRTDFSPTATAGRTHMTSGILNLRAAVTTVEDTEETTATEET
jgi:hypothetical protein